MIHFSRAIVVKSVGIWAVGLMVLAGCSNNEQATQTNPEASNARSTATNPSAQSTTPAAKDTATTKTQAAKDTTKNNDTTIGKPTDHKTESGDFAALSQVVSQTRADVETGNFKAAKETFDKFEDSWSKVEDGVKAKSAKTYDVIEEETDQVKSALKASDKAKSLSALQSLEKNIKTVSQS